MPLLKRKKQAALIPPPRWHQRAREIVNSHPITWGTLSAIVIFVATGYPLWRTIDEHWQSSAKAEMQYRELRRLLAWQAYGQGQQQVLVLRNRVNDCDAKMSPTPLESAACADYRREYQGAVDRAKTLLDEAMKASRE